MRNDIKEEKSAKHLFVPSTTIDGFGEETDGKRST